MSQEPPKFQYSCRCGWIDWNHAGTGEAFNLKHALEAGLSQVPGLHPATKIQLNGAPAFIVRWSFTGRYIPTYIKRDWVVRSNLSIDEMRSAALGMWRISGHEFERDQGRSWIWLKRQSSYSEEDMVSNLIGLYRALFGYSVEDIQSMCKVVSESTTEQMLKEWEKDKGLNYTDRPILHDCSECRSVDKRFPWQLERISDSPVGELFVPVRGRFLSGDLLIRSHPAGLTGKSRIIEFDRYGASRVI